MNAKSHITTFKWRHINAFPVHLSSNNSLEQCAVHAHEIVFFSREAWTVLPWRAFWIGVLNQRFKTLILPSQNKHERSLTQLIVKKISHQSCFCLCLCFTYFSPLEYMFSSGHNMNRINRNKTWTIQGGPEKNGTAYFPQLCGCNNWYQCMRKLLLRKMIPRSAIFVQ